MISGIGVDCVSIARMEKSMARPRFVQRVFSQQEQAYLSGLAPARAAASAAAGFAAKEAFLKAAGVGLGGYALEDIGVLRRESGQPYYVLSGTAAEFCAQNNLTAHLSLTHDGGMAIAFAVLEKCGG